MASPRRRSAGPWLAAGGLALVVASAAGLLWHQAAQTPLDDGGAASVGPSATAGDAADLDQAAATPDAPTPAVATPDAATPDAPTPDTAGRIRPKQRPKTPRQPPKKPDPAAPLTLPDANPFREP